MNKVIFLDRDGTINKKIENGYVTRPYEFEFLPGAIESLKLLAANGFEIIIITNQRGIARGIFTEDDLLDVHTHMQRELGEHGIPIKAVYYCPHDEGDGCSCRKPKPGMLLRAAGERAINLPDAVMIGDHESDVLAAEAAGCRGILIDGEFNLLAAVKKLV